jgi:carboxylate-amine ligase
MQQPSFTLGVEEEYQIVDPETRALRAHISRMLADEAFDALGLKPELHQSMVELATPVCQTPAEIRRELLRMRGTMNQLLAKDGLAIASAGSHPFSHWWEQEITPLERYVGVKQDMGDLAHRLLIFGMHIHVGIEDRELAIDLVNCVRYFLPHLLCLSTSSPFWIGRNTGLKSYRSSVFRGFPRTGIPTRLSGWSEFEQYVETLTDTGSIPNGSKIWWDVRPHYTYPTIEFRICDACTRVDEAVCIAAIVQALAYKLWKLRRDNLMWREYSSRLIEENKWRAMRFGLSGKLIDFGRRQEQPAPVLIRELVEWFIGDVVDELGTRREVEYVYRILDEGSSADRQLATFERTGSLEAVVDQLIAETAEQGLADQPVTAAAVARPEGSGVSPHVGLPPLIRSDGGTQGLDDAASGRGVPLAVEAGTLAAAANSAAANAHGGGNGHGASGDGVRRSQGPNSSVAPSPRPPAQDDVRP